MKFILNNLDTTVATMVVASLFIYFIVLQDINYKLKLRVFLWSLFFFSIIVMVFLTVLKDFHMVRFFRFFTTVVIHFLYPIIYYFYTKDFKGAIIGFSLLVLGTILGGCGFYDIIVNQCHITPLDYFRKYCLGSSIDYLFTNIITQLILIISVISFFLLIISYYARIVGVITEKIHNLEFFDEIIFGMIINYLPAKLLDLQEKFRKSFPENYRKYIKYLEMLILLAAIIIIVIILFGYSVNVIPFAILAALYVMVVKYTKTLDSLEDLEKLEVLIKKLQIMVEFAYQFYDPYKITFSEYLVYKALPKLYKLDQRFSFFLSGYFSKQFKILSITRDSKDPRMIRIVYNYDENNKNLVTTFEAKDTKELKSLLLFGLYCCMGVVFYFFGVEIFFAAMHFYYKYKIF